MIAMSDLKWTHLEHVQAVAQSACDRILAEAEAAISERNLFRIVLAGGSTPQMTYELLSQGASDWAKWEIYFGDERCLPAGHADLNSSMAKESLLERVPINPGNVYPIPCSLGAEQAAAQYIALIQAAMPFDMVLLGMGEDGHTASIFPDHHWQNKPPVYAVHGAPKPPAERVTLSAETLGNTRKLLYLITGVGKAEAISEWWKGKELPINSIPTQGDGEVLIDKEAGSAVVALE